MRTDTLPHSMESERAVLAAILLHPELMLEIDLTGREFYLEKHRLIWQALKDAFPAIDLRTTQAALEDRGALETVGGLSYLAGLDMDLPDPMRAAEYAGIVRDRHQKREIIRVSREMIQHAQNGHSPRDLVDILRTEVSEIEVGLHSDDEVRPLGEGMLAYVEELLSREIGDSLGISTGMRKLDVMTMGLMPGSQWAIGGRSGHGKTALALQISLEAARAGHRVLYVSREMSMRQIKNRALAHETGIPIQRIYGNYLNGAERNRILTAAPRIEKLPIYVDPPRDFSVESILAAARKQIRRFNTRLVVVDYLQLLSRKSKTKHENRHQELTIMSRELKSLALETDTTMLVLSQFSRKADQGEPSLGDFRDSSSIESDADICLGVYRPEITTGKNDQQAKLLLMKHRDGAPGAIPCRFDGDRVRFYQPES